MSITYTIAIDKSDNGNFDTPDNDITADVLRVTWRIGMTEPDQTVAPPTDITVTLTNRSGTYSPERTPVLIGQRIRIQSHADSTTRTHIIGHIERITPQTGTQGDQQAVLHARGIARQWQGQPIRLDVRTERRTDQLIQSILQQTQIRYPVLNGYCIIDRVGHNAIDSVFIFDDEPLNRNFDLGRSSLDYAGDTWREGIAAERAIEQVMQVEGGRFYVDREGNVRMLHRHRLLMSSVSATFNNDMTGVTYGYSEDIINCVRVQLTPRTVGAPNTRLWSLAQPLVIEPQQSQQLTVHYRDANGDPTGADNILTPQAAIHYRANTRRQSNGADVTDALTVTLRDVGFSAATVEIRNPSRRPVYLTQLDIRGTPITIGDTLTLTVQDDLSIAVHGMHTSTLSTALVTDPVEAAALAQVILLQKSSPRGTLRDLHLSTRSHPTQALARTLFDVIRVQEAQTEHDATYAIIGEQHTIHAGGADHRVTWLLEPVALADYVIVNQSTIDTADERLLPR